eukprot:15330068-Ditylum_brightwellii.AAC.1
MKIDAKSLKFVNHLVGNRPPPILLYMPDSEKKLSPLDYQTYKLQTNPKDNKLAVYSLMVKYYKVGTPEEWFQFINAIAHVIKGQNIQDGEAAYSLVKSLLRGDTLQVFQNKEESQETKDDPAFTKCLAAVTEHVFPKKAYKIQKKYIRNICKHLRLGSHKYISQMIKLNDYLVNFPVPEGVTATNISHEEFIDMLEDGIPFQWILELKKEGFNSSSVMIKEFLDTCICLEEAEMHKLLVKKIARAKKENEGDKKGKHHGKLEWHYKRHHGLGKCHAEKCKDFCVITMVFATMTQRCVTSIKLAENMFSLLTVSWISRGS